MSEKLSQKVPVVGGKTGTLPVTSETIEQLLAQGNIEQALKLLTARRELQALREDEEAQDERAREEEQRLLAIEEDIRRTAERQASCTHLKSNYKTAVHGIRDSRGNSLYLCLNCQKQWKNNELPMHLRVELPDLGGPAY